MQPPIDPPRPTVLDPTYARPEPWFVGSGKGLMITILVRCGVLLGLEAGRLLLAMYLSSFLLEDGVTGTRQRCDARELLGPADVRPSAALDTTLPAAMSSTYDDARG